MENKKSYTGKSGQSVKKETDATSNNHSTKTAGNTVKRSKTKATRTRARKKKAATRETATVNTKKPSVAPGNSMNRTGSSKKPGKYDTTKAAGSQVHLTGHENKIPEIKTSGTGQNQSASKTDASVMPKLKKSKRSQEKVRKNKPLSDQQLEARIKKQKKKLSNAKKKLKKAENKTDQILKDFKKTKNSKKDNNKIKNKLIKAFEKVFVRKSKVKSKKKKLKKLNNR